jgi:predicted PurR-regulated permease PerM
VGRRGRVYTLTSDPGAAIRWESMVFRDAWKIRALTWHVTLTVAGLAVSIWLIYSLRLILLLLALTVLFVYLLRPVVETVQAPLRPLGIRWRMPRSLAILLVYGGLLIGIGVALEEILPILADQISSFIDSLPGYAREFDRSIKQLATLPARYRLPLAWRQWLTGLINELPGQFFAWMQLLATRTFQLSLYLPWLILIPVMGYFLLRDSGELQRALLGSFPEEDLRQRLGHFLADLSQTLASYVRAQVLACLLVGTTSGIGFWVLGVPYPLLLGILAGLLELLPVFGPGLLLLLAIIAASFVSWELAAAVGGFLVIFRIIHDYLIYPRLISEGVKIHPLVVILAIVCGAELGGAIGIFLSVPLAALLLVGWQHWQELRVERAPLPEKGGSEP